MDGEIKSKIKYKRRVLQVSQAGMALSHCDQYNHTLGGGHTSTVSVSPPAAAVVSMDCKSVGRIENLCLGPSHLPQPPTGPKQES